MSNYSIICSQNVYDETAAGRRAKRRGNAARKPAGKKFSWLMVLLFLHVAVILVAGIIGYSMFGKCISGDTHPEMTGNNRYAIYELYGAALRNDPAAFRAVYEKLPAGSAAASAYAGIYNLSDEQMAERFEAFNRMGAERYGSLWSTVIFGSSGVIILSVSIMILVAIFLISCLRKHRILPYILIFTAAVIIGSAVSAGLGNTYARDDLRSMLLSADTAEFTDYTVSLPDGSASSRNTSLNTTTSLNAGGSRGTGSALEGTSWRVNGDLLHYGLLSFSDGVLTFTQVDLNTGRQTVETVHYTVNGNEITANGQLNTWQIVGNQLFVTNPENGEVLVCERR